MRFVSNKLIFLTVVIAQIILAIILNMSHTMNKHIYIIARTYYIKLRHLASIRRFLTSTANGKLISAFVLSRFEYSNSLLFGSTHDVSSHLQGLLNYAASSNLAPSIIS